MGLAGDIEVSGSVVFVGTGSHDGCSTAGRELMGLEEPCMLEPCAMYGRYMPAKGNTNFYAFSAFFFAANNLGLVDEDEAKVLTLGEIREATQRFCCRPWADVAEAAEREGKNLEYMRATCLQATLVSNLLEVYGFGDNDTSVTFARQLKETTLDWTRGAVIFQTESMPLAPPSGRRLVKDGKA